MAKLSERLTQKRAHASNKNGSMDHFADVMINRLKDPTECGILYSQIKGWVSDHSETHELNNHEKSLLEASYGLDSK